MAHDKWDINYVCRAHTPKRPCRANTKECLVTHEPAKKLWTRPELIRLGRMTDVAANLGVHTEGIKFNRS